MFARHYGPGYSSCPCAGMRAPSMAMGRHIELLTGALGLTASSILLGDTASRHPLTDGELQQLQADITSAKALVSIFIFSNAHNSAYRIPHMHSRSNRLDNPLL